ncbi:MAG: helix-turn-helix domain-containing protein [Pseudomonadota bacterium]
MDELDRLLGRRLRRRRRLLGMSQGELGRACGVRFQQIQKYEAATNRVSAVMLWKLAQALGVQTDYFFADVAPPSAKPAASEARTFLNGDSGAESETDGAP